LLFWRARATALVDVACVRRVCEAFVFEVEGLLFTATVSRSEDGKPLELFLNHHKHGNQVDTNARDAANALSFAPLPRADIEQFARRCVATATAGRSVRSMPRAIGWRNLKASELKHPRRHSEPSDLAGMSLTIRGVRSAMTALTFQTLLRSINGKFGIYDISCLLCGPEKRSSSNRVRRVLRVWYVSPGFISFVCARCGEGGFIRDRNAPRIDAVTRARVSSDLEQH
jgi:hypothetical protein